MTLGFASGEEAGAPEAERVQMTDFDECAFCVVVYFGFLAFRLCAPPESDAQTAPAVVLSVFLKACAVAYGRFFAGRRGCTAAETCGAPNAIILLAYALDAGALATFLLVSRKRAAACATCALAFTALCAVDGTREFAPVALALSQALLVTGEWEREPGKDALEPVKVAGALGFHALYAARAGAFALGARAACHAVVALDVIVAWVLDGLVFSSLD